MHRARSQADGRIGHQCRDAIRSRTAFTLIEILIVVSIMAIIAAIILPQLVISATDSKDATLRQNLKILREQIDLFKLHHKGNAPGFGGADPAMHLLQYSDVDGAVSKVAAPECPLGPYLLKDLAENPINNGRALKISAAPNQEKPDNLLEEGGLRVGWFYNPASGAIAPNAEGTAGDGMPRIDY